MATVTNLFAGDTDTLNVTSYVGPSFTPTAGDLLVIFAGASGTVAASPTMTASANGLTFTLLGSATKNTSADTLYAYVANQLVPASPSAMTVTFDCTGDAATGCIISGAGVTGISKISSAAVLQYAEVNNVLGGTAPSTVFTNNCDTNSPTLQAVLTGVGTGSTPPTNWTEQVDVTYATPTTGGGYSSRDSGFASTTITLGSTTNGACCAIALELDASALPLLVMGPRN